MNDQSRDIREAMDAVSAGRLDSLSAEQMARLEAHLRVDPAAAAQLAALRPPIEPALRAAIPAPAQEAWEQAWRRIDAASKPAGRPAAAWRVLRPWPSLFAAAAAGVLLVGWWALERRPAASDWPVEWARGVEIAQLEVAQGTTPFVWAGSGEDGIPVIWVLDDEG